MDTLDVPHLFYSKFNTLICHAYYQDTTWVREIIGLADLFEMPLYGMSAMGPDNNPYYVYMSLHNMVRFWKQGGTWHGETIERFGTNADFAWSTPYIYVDRRDWTHCLYDPWYDAYSNYRLKYAYRDSTGCHREFAEELGTRTFKLSPVVDSAGIVHVARGSPFGVYRLCRYPGDTLWHTEEMIDTLFQPEPRPDLVLIPANRGFYIIGYSGEARIYDPAARLVLSKEIKGKTLVSPLSPGFYFVIVGKEKAGVAIR